MRHSDIDKENAVLAVDADIVAYKIACVFEAEDFFEAVKSAVRTTIANIATTSGVSKMRFYFTGENNFRYRVATVKPYKGNRADRVKPRHLQAIKDFMVEEYGAVVVHGYEADDAIATDMRRNGAIHCGIDKDIKQCMGWHYNYIKDEWDYVTDKEGVISLYRQVLTGDSTDNIGGLPRVGEKKAEKVVYDAHTARDDAFKMYQDFGIEGKLPDIDPSSYFLETYMLVAMVDCVSTIPELFSECFTIVAPNEKEFGFAPQRGTFTGFKAEPIMVKGV